MLERFSPATQDWFRGAFPAPTPAQVGAWDAISARQARARGRADRFGQDARGVPLGDRPARRSEPRQPDEKPGTRVLYISPLKALGVDVERNLRSPLVGIGADRQAPRASDRPHVTVGVRSGDTTSTDRRKLVTDAARHPDHDARVAVPDAHAPAGETLRDVQTVIIDEVHAVAATKRGAHLAVSLERLDALLDDSPRSASGCRRRCARSRRSRASSAAGARSRSWRRRRRRGSTCGSSCRSTT